MISNLRVLFFYFNICLFVTKCGGQDIETTVKTLFIETTTELITLITDIPEEDVEEALNIDYGRYTTQSVSYINSQFYSLVGQEILPCFDRYIKCLVTVVVPHPVCTVNDPYDLYQGFRTFDSYCEAYLDNCLRRMRFWRIIDYGECIMDWKKYELKEVAQTRRKYSQSFKDIFNLLTEK